MNLGWFSATDLANHIITDTFLWKYGVSYSRVQMNKEEAFLTLWIMSKKELFSCMFLATIFPTIPLLFPQQDSPSLAQCLARDPWICLPQSLDEGSPITTGAVTNLITENGQFGLCTHCYHWSYLATTSLVHGKLQHLNQQPKSLNRTNLVPLHIYNSCVAWFICGTPGDGNRGCLWCFGWLWTYSSSWIALPILNTWGGAWSSGKLGVLCFAEAHGRPAPSEWLGRRLGWEWGEWGRKRRGRGGCSQGIKQRKKLIE